MRIPMFLEKVGVPKAIFCEAMKKDKIADRNSKITSCPPKKIKFHNQKRKAL